MLADDNSLGDWIAPFEVERKTIQERQGVPTVAHLGLSDPRIALELSNHDVHRSLAGLIASDEVQIQSAFNAGCSAVGAMISSECTNATGSRVLPADNSLARWTAPSEVQENNAGKAGASKC